MFVILKNAVLKLLSLDVIVKFGFQSLTLLDQHGYFRNCVKINYTVIHEVR